MSPVDLKDYVDVKERIRLFYERYPEGRLCTGEVKVTSEPDGVPRVWAQAFAYRDPTDLHPGTGWSWLILPGSTNFTRGSEIENAETSAWGRAIGATGIGIAGSIASADEVRNKGGSVRADVERGNDGSLIGVVEVGDKQSSDFQLRQTPEGPATGFRLRGDKGGILVEARGPLADRLYGHRAAVVGQRVTVWGTIGTRSFRPPKATKDVEFQVLDAERVGVPEVGTLDGHIEAESLPIFDDEDQAAIDLALA